MVLPFDVFSAVRINWRPKPENMASIAEELNIGLESMLFLDDNPAERAQMRDMLPQVMTPELPADPARFRDIVECLPQLQTLAVTDADRSRVEQYRARRDREAARADARSLDEYLGGLGIEAAIGPATDATLARVYQLFQRTNQFNVTGRRYDAGRFASLARDAGWRLYSVRSRDRFGDHGLVAAALVRADPREWALDGFVMSCRAIGYGIETALIAALCEAARSAGARALIGEFVETPKNAPARDLFARHGFVTQDEPDSPNRWRLLLTEAGVTTPPWIALTVTHGT